MQPQTDKWSLVTEGWKFSWERGPQGWSGASKETQPPPGAQHQRSQTQVSISIKLCGPSKET